MRPMDPAEMLVRIGVGAFLILLAIFLQAAEISGILILIGAGWIIWTAIRAVLQVRKAERIQRERRARR